jgi:hypothetical protein
MQPIAAVFVVAVLFVVVNTITPAFTTVRWSKPVAIGWTSRAPYPEAAQFFSSSSRHDLL